MDHIIFWQTVGAVILGNTLFALSAYMVWRVAKEERGQMGRASAWVFFVGLIAPAVGIFALVMLP
ncbi:hypothetical protein [Paracoccus sp. SY]|uniref:hypothetical protein n=1 Tax=Paracoccus sp. SY TaxID=1330255 RepID=UPI0011AFB0BB|nr:hypothetical protein [Paracoccus sp. SY]